MESNLRNQDDLLQQLETLRAEKDLLEKHVFVLNECLSVEELKSKIADLEIKKKSLISLESMIERIRAEIEPLKYLKSILEKKITTEKQANQLDIDFKSSISILTSNTSENLKSLLQQSTQNIPNESIQRNSVSSQEINYKPLDAVQIPDTSNSVYDECLQLLDQYDIVTDQDMLNLPEEVSRVQLLIIISNYKIFCFYRINLLLIKNLVYLTQRTLLPKYKINKQLHHVFIVNMNTTLFN